MAQVILKDMHMNTNQKKTGMTILISDTVDFWIEKKIARYKEGNYIMIRGSNHQEYIRILNVYVPKKRTSSIMKSKH